VYAIKLIDKAASGVNVTDKEIAVMLRIHHENCVNLYEVYETETEVQMVLECLEGGDLFDQIINNGSYTEAAAKVVMKKICIGVQYMHTQGIMHRDLKPENILLVSEDSAMDVKVADFGLSRLFPEGAGPGQKTGTVCGTPVYVAPEVLAKKQYGYGVDVWALGVIAYIMLCGSPPFPLDMDPKSVRMVRTSTFYFQSPDWDDISDDCKDFIKQMIVADPEERAKMEDVLAHPFLKD